MTTSSAKLNKHISKQIKTRRENMDITKVELAKRTGLSDDQIAHYEAGRRSIPVECLRRLCIAMNLSLDNLVGINQPEYTGQAPGND